MDPRAYWTKLKDLRKDKKKAARIAAGLFACAFALGFAVKAGPAIWTQTKLAGHAVAPNLSPRGFFVTYRDAFRSLQAKVDELKRADEENRRLNLENANLRLKLESAQFDCGSQTAARGTQKIEFTLDQETGSRVGRSLATIGYKLPTHLLPQQLYTLAVSYFKAKEDEKAVVILTFLTSMEEEEAYKTAKNYLMAGVSWYRLDNYELADEYFDKVIKAPVNPDAGTSWQIQARMWKALVAERQGKKEKSQYLLHEILDEYPHSTEAAWVNSLAHVERMPAASRGARSRAANRKPAQSGQGGKAKAKAVVHAEARRVPATRLPTETRSEKLHAHVRIDDSATGAIGVSELGSDAHFKEESNADAEAD